ncbi:hypothetical protein THASP1DRAFT_32392 [Thamnocephalis sphaerospora]|uniref:Uncharacterized protein n=1 Tax=Thamnocephalis sphaerospora TaxID=78915 RepID=A0A4P9XJ54_9FUNG|nr:hypothetical protein THASP1DRAFT_32392 [Thamnocephalis sphaerospora]|eukprot:RKP05774.1 hypothetical protein THASP1DRAFT_32392 [Thamnocephalis sphaerospora]
MSTRSTRRDTFGALPFSPLPLSSPLVYNTPGSARPAYHTPQHAGTQGNPLSICTTGLTTPPWMQGVYDGGILSGADFSPPSPPLARQLFNSTTPCRTANNGDLVDNALAANEIENGRACLDSTSYTEANPFLLPVETSATCDDDDGDDDDGRDDGNKKCQNGQTLANEAEMQAGSSGKKRQRNHAQQDCSQRQKRRQSDGARKKRRPVREQTQKEQQSVQEQAQKAVQLQQSNALEIRRLNVARDKDDCAREMTVVLGGIAAEKTAICDALEDVGCAVQVVDTAATLPSSLHSGYITWRRRAIARYDSEQRLFVPLSASRRQRDGGAVELQDEPYTLALLQAADWIAASATQSAHETLVRSLRRNCPQHHLTIVIVGIGAHLRKRKKQWHHWYAACVRSSGSPSNGSEITDASMPDEALLGPDQREIERRLLVLQVDHQCGVILAESWRGAAKWVCRLTREIAFKPYIKTLPSAVGIPHVRSGKNAKDAWIIALEQVQACSNAMAQAVAKKYPTPRSLYTAFLSCDTLHAAEHLLDDIQVVSGPYGAQQVRRLGPTVSRRIYRSLMATDSEETIR